ncbi:hypothetical protein DUNSADRAFT_269 [Dunaliella salina]|uniref:Encoded protein n=1 Tax=Dunaliella salina TaxID=3046 RepID=A0ABQ7FZ81_DUNSA|nr:hypothetical protein DUNSADRAFT_269 [Dunaliella salina]|eukprot:KAF5827667.1 hypothetical protein DUNSADRAFT_269 [Dunaliella salina]
MLRCFHPGSHAAKSGSTGLPVRSGSLRQKLGRSLKAWSPNAFILSSSLRNTNQQAALKWGHRTHSPHAPSNTAAPWIARALNRPTLGGSFSSGESSSDDDDDFHQDLNEDGFDYFAKSPAKIRATRSKVQHSYVLAFMWRPNVCLHASSACYLDA